MKYLVVGAGFTGAVIARELAEAGHSVHIIDKRDHIAGNAYDYEHQLQHGNIRCHKYGPHLFHTNNDRVFEYLSRFTNWTPYKHKVKAVLNDGRYATLPVNKETKEMVGEENVLDIFFRPYTKKMWGVELDELDPSIINRVPIRDDDNEFYFPNDKHQYLPTDGYTTLISRILTHNNIIVSLSVDFEKHFEDYYDHVFNSMPIDEYYEFQHGELPYRSIKFLTFPQESVKNQDVPLPPAATINFTDDSPYTRITIWNMLPNHGVNHKQLLQTLEEPCDYLQNNMERYYPVKDVKGINKSTYQKYKDIPNEMTTFVGRCGMYVYIDMDQAVNIALQTVKKHLGHEYEDVSNSS